MLRLLYGAAGSGKTQFVCERLKALSRGNVEKIMLIVPEQFSFETERKLLSMLGEQPFSRVEVYSFTRLCQRIFELYGGGGSNYADSTAKILLMEMALREISDALQHYRKAAGTRPFILSALGTVEELKHNGISSAAYEAAVERVDDPSRASKLREIALIYSTYQGLLERSYQDSLDDFSKAIALVEEHGFFEGYTVFLDEFKGFTKPELDLITLMLRQAASCTVTLCTDRINENDLLFSCVKKTGDSLKRIAFENRVAVETPVFLTEQHRFSAPPLAFLEQNVFRSGGEPFEGENSAVSAFVAVNEYDEVDYALSWIAKLVQEKGYRYRDIVVMCRSLNDYKRVLEPAFRKYQIPYFIDSRFDIASFPPVRFVTAALDAAVSRLDTENVLGLLKCFLMPFSLEEVSALENYVFLWNINGSRWELPFTANPRGFKGELTKEDEAALRSLNRIREAVVSPLAALRAACSDATVREIAQALYRFFERTRFLEIFAESVEQDRERGEHDKAEIAVRIWELLMKVLDDMVTTSGDVRMKLDRFAELFVLAVRNSELADRPQTLDCVLVGSPERMRTDSPKAVAILGVNDGVFPFVPLDGSLLQEEERRLLSGLGLELQGDFRERVLEERFVAYKALCAPSSDLLLTCRRADVAGNVQQISPLIKQITALFSESALTDSDRTAPSFYCRTTETTYLTLAKEYAAGGDTVKTLLACLEETSIDRTRLERLRTALEPQRFGLKDPDLAERLFGGKIRLSPSRIEAYFRCPFAYFCRYGLKVLPRVRAELNPLERGLAIHDLLYRFVSEHGETMLSLSEEEVKTIVGGYLKDYLDEVMGGEADKPKRFLSAFYRLRRTVSDIVLRLIAEFKQSDFRPVDFELETGGSENVAPLRIETADGGEIVVSGTIDRVDLCEIGGRKYVRVVDYKSGIRKFKFSDVYYGLNLQMILYLFMLWKNGKKKYEGVFPAGVLYMPAGDGTPDLSRNASEEDLRVKKLAQYKMNGFVLKDPAVISAMEKEIGGVFIPVSQNKDGSFAKTSSLLKLEELGKLERYVSRLILRMASMLREGEIAASPSYSRESVSPCTYCDYATVCGQKRKAEKLPPLEDMTTERFLLKIGGDEDAGA